MQQEQHPDAAVAGLLVVLLIASAFPATSKWAIYLGLFLLGITWISSWQNKSLQNTLQVFQAQIHGGTNG